MIVIGKHEQRSIFYVYDAPSDEHKKKLAITVHEEGRVQVTILFLYQDTLTYDIAVHLIGRGASASITCIVLAGNSQELSINSYQYHDVAYTTSAVWVRGVVADQACARHTGTIVIAQQAYEADARQQCEFLIDGDQARAFAQPILEVLNHQVRCAHGAAIGRLDSEQLFYCAKTGIGLVQARTLLTRAFLLAPITATTDQELVRSALEHVYR